MAWIIVLSDSLFKKDPSVNSALSSVQLLKKTNVQISTKWLICLFFLIRKIEVFEVIHEKRIIILHRSF